MATNRKIYQVEVRQFFKTENQFDVLNACSPFIVQTCSSKKKAKENYEKTLFALNLNKSNTRELTDYYPNEIVCGVAQQNYVDNMRYVVLVKQYKVI
jgi:hypothetical protein